MASASVWAALFLAAVQARGDGGTPAAARPDGPHFAVVADEPCEGGTTVADFGERTLLVSRTRARFFEPGRPAREALDVSAGLPLGRGRSMVFSTRPLILDVAEWPGHRMEKGIPSRRFRFADERWIELLPKFPDVAAVLPVETGLVVTGWVSSRFLGDLGGVPAGDLTRAWRVGLDGTVSPWSTWPNVLTWQERSTPKVVWAVAAEPRGPGMFLIRAPIDGRPQLFPIPGLAGCRGDERLSMPADLLGATGDEARVAVSPWRTCKHQSGSGTYRLLASRGRWVREGPFKLDPRDDPRRKVVAPREDLVAGGRGFTRGTGEILVSEASGEPRHYPIPGVQPGPMTSIDAYSELEASAAGREIWLTVHDRGRCRVYRY
ncbi:MAG TPA: hypothetical protein VKZ18_21360 [Polyangia bacterium]|nr:hypothetical protein [Polyangia bacterium]